MNRFQLQTKQTWTDNETISVNAISYATVKTRLKHILSPCAAFSSMAKETALYFGCWLEGYMYVYIFMNDVIATLFTCGIGT
jgi:hypothetical protein